MKMSRAFCIFLAAIGARQNSKIYSKAQNFDRRFLGQERGKCRVLQETHD
jgi:hypothetical protein